MVARQSWDGRPPVRVRSGLLAGLGSGLPPVEGSGLPRDMPKGRHTASRRRVKAARQFLGWSPAGRAVATSTAL